MRSPRDTEWTHTVPAITNVINRLGLAGSLTFVKTKNCPWIVFMWIRFTFVIHTQYVKPMPKYGNTHLIIRYYLHFMWRNQWFGFANTSSVLVSRCKCEKHQVNKKTKCNVFRKKYTVSEQLSCCRCFYYYLYYQNLSDSKKHFIYIIIIGKCIHI